jgi:hypothetical protein
MNEVSLGFPQPLQAITSNQATAASFHMSSMSLITNYPTIRREIIRVAGNSFKKSIDKYKIKPTFHGAVIFVLKT